VKYSAGLVTLRSTPLGDLDQAIRLFEGTFSENLSQLAQKRPATPPGFRPRSLLVALKWDSKASWVTGGFAECMRGMIQTIGGRNICGDVRHWRMYRDRIKARAKLRKELDDAVERIARVYAEYRAT